MRRGWIGEERVKASVMIEEKESVIFPRSFFVLFIFNESLRCLFDTLQVFAFKTNNLWMNT